MDTNTAESDKHSSNSHYREKVLERVNDTTRVTTAQTTPNTDAMVPTIPNIVVAKTKSSNGVLGKCMDINGSFDVDICVKYLQSQLSKMSLKKYPFQKQLGRILTKFNLGICLDHLEIVRYNRSEQLCCDGVLNRTASYERCCDGKVIDIRIQLCCDDVVYEKQDNNGCCGTFLYDKSEQFCCGDELHNISQDHGCCGTSVFSRKVQTCCHGYIQQSFDNGNNKDCCNSTNLKDECYSCVNGKQLMTSFNESREMCCNGKVSQKKYDNASECCSETVMDIRTQTCKNGKIFQKDEENTKAKHLAERIKSTDATMKNKTMTKYNHFIIMGIVLAVSPFGALCLIVFVKNPKKFQTSNSNFNPSTLSTNTLITSQSSNDSGTVVPKYSRAKEAKICNQQENVNLIQEDLCSFSSASNTERGNITITYDHHELLTFESSLSFSDLSKPVLIPKWNLENEHFVESHTQTISQQPTTKRTIFDTPFDNTYLLDEANPTLQMPDSEVSMTLPLNLTRTRKVEVSSSTFRNIEAINDKLDVPENERIASPVVEYSVVGNSKLDYHACIRIPFVGKQADLSVKKFDSDEGIGTTATSTVIPRKDQENVSLDCYYIVKGQFVFIYTKSFSGFYCTRCKHKRNELELVTFVFGSYKRPNEQYEVFITVYIADEIFKFRDYGQDMFRSEETDQGRNILRRDVRLEMPDCDLSDQDHVEASLTVKYESAKWMHVIKPSNGMPVYPERKIIKLAKIAQKCPQCCSTHTRENGRPVPNHWYLSNKQNAVPSNKFQCFIDLDVCKKDTDIRENTPITIDELKLQKNDHVKMDGVPIQETRYDFAEGGTKTLREGTGAAVGYLPNTGRETDTLVRAESEPTLISTSLTPARRHIPPSPELSQENETLGPAALLDVSEPS